MINLIIAIPDGVRKVRGQLRADNNRLTESGDENKDSAGEGSNIYYLLCDEYAGFTQLKKDFGFSNSVFREDLADMGFYISDTSSNDSASTQVVMANIMAMDYVCTMDTPVPELQFYHREGKLHTVLENCGYVVQGIGSTAWLGVEGTRDRPGEATDDRGIPFSELVLDQTLLYFIYENKSDDYAGLIEDSFDDLKNMPIEPDIGTFTLFYVECPHHPYYFKGDGSRNRSEEQFNYDGEHPERYIGQVQYVNSQLLVALQRIIDNDPNCIIILCSDHGNRFGIRHNEYVNLILNAVYYKGEDASDIEGLSGLNTIIYVLNQEKGLDMDYMKMGEQGG